MTQRPVATPTMAAFIRAGLLDEQGERTRGGDEFRIAASRVGTAVAAALAAGEPGANLVMVTSTRPGEGKSFTAVNLAAALAQVAPRPVLLVDADQKRECLTDLLGLLGEPGLADLAADPAREARELILPTPLPDLSLMPLGSLGAATRARSTLGGTVSMVAAALPEMTVLLDAGPLLATSDPSILAPVVGTIIFIVEAARTQRHELEAALELVRGCKRLLLLLNKAAPRRRGAFGAYSYYYGANALPPAR